MDWTPRRFGEKGLRDVGYVYFILAPHSQCVKIGYTAGRPQDRMDVLQIGSPELLCMLGWIEGDESLERRLHESYRDEHVRGEWFQLCPDLRRFILSETEHLFAETVLESIGDFSEANWNCNPFPITTSLVGKEHACVGI